MTDTVNLRPQFDRIMRRIFRKEYFNRIQYDPRDQYTTAQVDDCIQAFAINCMSPGKVEQLARIVEPGLLAAMYDRHERIVALLDKQRIHATFGRMQTDGQIMMAFLVDLWSIAELTRTEDSFSDPDFADDI